MTRTLRATFCLLVAGGAAMTSLHADFPAPNRLEIHYINVGQGGATLIIGPDGTRLLYDFGNIGRGEAIARYLLDMIKLAPEDGIHYAIVSHRDVAHYGGYAAVIQAGYTVLNANFDSGSRKPASAQMDKHWLTPAAGTRAGAVRPIPVGLRIALGDGAEARIIAANGQIHRRDPWTVPFARDENDRSISIYVKYKDFDYLLDGDLGAGTEGPDCADRQTGQKDFQGPVAQALIAAGWMKAEFGVDVLHIANHGSESSTSSGYYNAMKPQVGLISVGLDQRQFLHPREDVTTKVLLGPTRPCVTAPPLLALFQTETGKAGMSNTGRTSFKGLPLGDIRLTTDGTTDYQIAGTGRVEAGGRCNNPAAGFWRFPLDERSTPGAVQVNAKCTVTSTSCSCSE